MTEIIVPLRLDADDLWSGIFGAAVGTWSWWHTFDFQGDADWDKHGEVIITAWDPDYKDYEGDTLMTRTINVQNLADSYGWYIRAGYKTTIDDMDACYSDVVLQHAFYGEVIWG